MSFGYNLICILTHIILCQSFLTLWEDTESFKKLIMAMKSLCQKKERNVCKQKIFMYFKEVVGPPEAFPGSQVTWF